MKFSIRDFFWIVVVIAMWLLLLNKKYTERVDLNIEDEVWDLRVTDLDDSDWKDKGLSPSLSLQKAYSIGEMIAKVLNASKTVAFSDWIVNSVCLKRIMLDNWAYVLTLSGARYAGDGSTSEIKDIRVLVRMDGKVELSREIENSKIGESILQELKNGRFYFEEKKGQGVPG